MDGCGYILLAWQELVEGEILQQLVPDLAMVVPRPPLVVLYNIFQLQATFGNTNLLLLFFPRVLALDVVLRPRGMSGKRENGELTWKDSDGSVFMLEHTENFIICSWVWPIIALRYQNVKKAEVAAILKVHHFELAQLSTRLSGGA